MIAERIKRLREERNISQAELARCLGTTRNAVNSWEQGYTVPSMENIVELAKFFYVSTDYLLGIESSSALNLAGLTTEDVTLLVAVANHMRSKNKCD